MKLKREEVEDINRMSGMYPDFVQHLAADWLEMEDALKSLNEGYENLRYSLRKCVEEGKRLREGAKLSESGKVIDYQILDNREAGSPCLVEAVKEMLARGWELHGDVVILQRTMYQVMVRREPRS